MRSTAPLPAPRDPSQFPTVQLFILAIVRLAEPIALTSIFPYAWALVRKFQVGAEQDASFYAGLLISAFALAESLTGMFWGSLSDRIGRKPVLLLGCFGTLLSLLIVGFSTNIWTALAGRALGGFLNGNIGVIQTMVGELVTRPEHEPKAYSIMPFVWSIGTIIGPAIGGTFADPHMSFPDMFSEDGFFGKFPYLLPNLICASLLLVSMTAGFVLLEETHPDLQPRGLLHEVTFVSAGTPLIGASDSVKKPAVDMRDETYGSLSSDSHLDVKKEYAVQPSLFSKRIMSLMIAFGIFIYHSMTYDHLLPIFLEDERPSVNAAAAAMQSGAGGLGLSLRAVGAIMSVNGIIALFVQAVVFPICAERIGVYSLLVIVTVLHPLAYFVMPFLVYLPEDSLWAGIYACLALRNLLSILAYPLLLIMIKEATPSRSLLGTVNGLSASVGAGCRTIAPPVAGYLYALGSQMEITGLAWGASGFVAFVGAIQCFSIPRSARRGSLKGDAVIDED